MKQSKPFKYYCDAGHGWVAVKRNLLITLGIASEITSFSYQRGATVYLEEDKDLMTFMEAYERTFGCEVDLQASHCDQSPIRHYDHYKPEG